MNNQPGPVIGPTSFSFKGINWKEVGIHTACVAAGAVLTYATSWVTGTDFGQYTPVVVAGWAIVSKVAQKWVSDNE